ncbi:hypothetical protein NDU88_001764 [Pleurodeles waltl]|uniref:Uncharacterized protein n=1 Tax=Pleurodeles waltl TaxID=8319 RepID=A0AAV7M0K1_PLEWA|nr:hypothetical protein NDU88_001764 [Pleurodeles waltl]
MAQASSQDGDSHGVMVRESLLNQPVQLVQCGQENGSLYDDEPGPTPVIPELVHKLNDNYTAISARVETSSPEPGPEKQGLQDGWCGDRQKGAKSAREEEPRRRKNSEVWPSHSITEMLRALSMELKGGVETSNANQLEIRKLCEDLFKKTDELAGRMAILEVEVGHLSIAVEENKERIQSLKVREENAMAKLESLENNQRGTI